MKIRDVPQTGSVGETVIYQSRFGIIRRRKVIPRDPRTGPQLDRQTAFQRARSFWSTFTHEQFLAWNTLPRTRHTHPLLGQSSDLSGYELAVQINVHLATLGLPMVPTPSPGPGLPPSGHPQATLRLPRGSREGLVQGGRNRGLEGRLEVVIPRTNPPKRGRSPRTQTVTPSTK